MTSSGLLFQMILFIFLGLVAGIEMYTIITVEHGNEFPWSSASIQKVDKDGSQHFSWPLEVHGDVSWDVVRRRRTGGSRHVSGH